MKVSIYINSYHTGHLSKGTGCYGSVIEYITKKGEPITKEIFDKSKPITKNKSSLQACIKSIEELTKECEIDLYINNTYITETINQQWYLNWDKNKWKNKGKDIPNVDEWKILLELMNRHKINFIFQERTSYTSYIDTMLKRISEKEK